jgi:AAA family ATP:ADP antiporter
LLIGSVLLLEVALFAVRRLSRLAGTLDAEPASAADHPVGGSVFAGITHPFKSAYLVNVSVFILLFAITATLLYFEQAGIVSRSFADRGEQTAFFATIDLLVNCLTLAVQLFLTGRILRYFGVGLALAFLPLLTLFGFATLAFVPALSALVVFQVLRRASDYAVARPAREVLYTVLPREDRYKAKNFIDTVVYRGGDQIGAWSYALLAALGLGVAEVAAVAIALSVVWLINGLWLGRKQELMAAAKPAKIQAV